MSCSGALSLATSGQPWVLIYSHFIFRVLTHIRVFEPSAPSRRSASGSPGECQRSVEDAVREYQVISVLERREGVSPER